DVVGLQADGGGGGQAVAELVGLGRLGAPDDHLGADARCSQLLGGLLLVAAVGDKAARSELTTRLAAEPVNPLRYRTLVRWVTSRTSQPAPSRRDRSRARRPATSIGGRAAPLTRGAGPRRPRPAGSRGRRTR